MDIQTLPISQINPAPYNPRKKLKPGDPEFEKLKNSIETFGFVELIVVNKRTGYTVISGHQRLNVLRHLQWTEVECVVVDLDEASEKALNLAMNKVSGEWDVPMLTDLLKDLDASGFDLTFTGFDPAELDDLFTKTSAADVKDDDTFDLTAALEKSAFVKPGDVWIVGKHRLMCGDATKPQDVATLMDNKQAQLCITDPPYNCQYIGGTGLTIMNDNMDGQAFFSFLLSAFKNIYASLADGSAVYIFHSDAEKCNFFNATVQAGFHYSTTCVWVKNALVLGRMDYHMRHEPIIYAFKDTAKHRWYADRSETTVWDFDRPTKSKLHPTTKPIPLIAYPMRNSSPVNGIVLDLFGGSGSTLLTAEQLDRVCYMMEIDPKYASVIIRRFTAFAGNTNGIKVLRDGRLLDCSEIYVPSDDDLAYQDINVNKTSR